MGALGEDVPAEGLCVGHSPVEEDVRLLLGLLVPLAHEEGEGD